MTGVEDRTLKVSPPPGLYSRRSLPGLLLVAGGATSLAGWLLDQPRMTDWFVTGIYIQPNAALCAVLCGLGALLALRGRLEGAAVAGTGMLLLGGLTLLQHLTGWNFGIDTPLTLGQEWGYAGTVTPGRMGLPASTAWTLLGLGLVCVRQPATRRLVPWLAGVAGGLAALSLAGYLYGAVILVAIPRLTTIAFQTAVFVALGAAGLLAAVPEREPVRTLLEDGAAGILARRSFVLLVGLPALAIYAGLRAEQAGLINRSLGAALTLLLLVAASYVVLSRALVAARGRELALDAARRARNAANEARAQSEARVAGILESIDDAFVIFDAEWRFQYVNGAAARALDRSPAALFGRGLWDVLPEARGTRMEEALLTVARQRITVEFEGMDPKSGRWYSNRAYPTADGGVSVYFRDVNDQRAMQERAWRGEQQAQTLIRHMPGAVFMLDRELRFLVADGASLREWSLAGAEFIGRTLDEVLDPEKTAVYRPLCESALAGHAFMHEDELDGRVFNTRGVPLRAEDGSIYAVLAISHDITERKRGELAMAASARQLHLVTDVAPVMLAHLDRAMRYRFVNRPYAARFGMVPADLVGRTVTQVFGEAAYRRFEHQVRAVLAGETVQFEVEMQSRITGSTQYLYASYTPEVDSGGQVIGLVAGLVDISGRRRAEEALRESDRRKDEFLATLAHELRSPLAPISNSIDILDRSAGDPDLVRTVRQTLRRQVSHLTRLVDDLLDIGRINRNRLELRKEHVELAAIIRQATESCIPLIRAAGQHLDVQLPPGRVLVHGDPVRLAQVFSNLLTNASRYNHAGGHIGIVARLDGDAVEVRVRDSGIGIPTDQLGKVFEPFVQIQGSTSRQSGGLGIGLSLVHRLVGMHGGTVEARSDGPGHGAEFLVRLPVERAAPAPAPLPAARAEAAARRILVVDDSADSADSLALLLELSGHQVQKAYTGAAALEQVAASRPEVVILDLGLPDMSGYDVCRRLRDGGNGSADLLVVALTGWGQPADREKTAAAGFDAHLVKPVDLGALVGVIGTRFGGVGRVLPRNPGPGT